MFKRSKIEAFIEALIGAKGLAIFLGEAFFLNENIFWTHVSKKKS